MGNKKKKLHKKRNKHTDLANRLTIKSLISSKLKSNDSDVTYVGIDFGTSTTVVSIASSKDGLESIQSDAIELNQKLYDGAIYKSYKIPTMIGWYNNSLLVGEGANQIKLKLKKDKTLWHSFKMDLGVDMGALYPYSELNNEKIKLLNPKDVATLFFKYLKVQIEKYVKINALPNQIEYAVSIPASFEANQRKDLLDSLHANDMMTEKQALIDEPNAAFLSYVSNSDLKDDIYISEEYPTNILVFDFGAGTCDISILEVANSPKGFYSKNVAISRFEALGGNDIDKLIVKEILLPQFLEENNTSRSSFKTKELKIIEERLEKPAELLKIKISEEISLFSDNENFNDMLSDDFIIMIHAYNQIVSMNHSVEFKTKKGKLTLKRPQMSYQEFVEINDRFTDTETEWSTDKSIFSPIFSAMKKANLEVDDIDYVLFVGGSAKNYFMQKAITEYFDEAEYLIPKDLQAHVSSGAAIHSLMFNGYGKNIIDPITSEPILLLMKEEDEEYDRILLKAGTTIPCETIVIDDLKPQRDGQNILELPLCIGSRDKLLHNVKIEAHEAFTMDSKIQLKVSINADKMLVVNAVVDGRTMYIEPLNPFRNQDVSVKEKQKFDAEKEYNKIISANKGKATRESLNALHKAYEKLGYHLQAAEMLEELYDKFGMGSLNNIGVAYSRSGDENKALKFYELDMEESPSAIVACNIALKYKYSNQKEYKKWLEKSLDLDSDYETAQYLYGVVLDKAGNAQGIELIKKAFNALKLEYESGYAENSDIHWLKECAKYLDADDYAVMIDKSLKKEKLDFQDYDSENLTSRKIKG